MMNTKADKAQSCSLIMCRFGKWSIQEGMYSVTTETAIKIHPGRQSSYNVITMYTNQKLSNKTNPYSPKWNRVDWFYFSFWWVCHTVLHTRAWYHGIRGNQGCLCRSCFTFSSQVPFLTLARFSCGLSLTRLSFWSFLFTLLLWLVSYLGRVK